MCVVLCCVCLVVVSGGGVGADGVEDDFFPNVVEVFVLRTTVLYLCGVSIVNFNCSIFGI